ncbi:MAG: hypothetical protein ACFB4I_19840 [Cyanophyceae cyanobacterium]
MKKYSLFAQTAMRDIINRVLGTLMKTRPPAPEEIDGAEAQVFLATIRRELPDNLVYSLRMGAGGEGEIIFQKPTQYRGYVIYFDDLDNAILKCREFKIKVLS